MGRFGLCAALTAILAALVLATVAAPARAEDWPRLELRGLARETTIAPVDIAVPDDPVFHGPKRYRGLPLAAVLATIPGIEGLARDGALAVFKASDGYTASMDLRRALDGGGVLATRDLDAPAGQDWIPLEQGGHPVSPAPLYLVWPPAARDDLRYVWPYQIESVSVQPFAVRYGASVPETDDPAVRRGFEHARLRCLVCHAVNLVGGEMGPELNVPMNATEYWKPEMLPHYILDAPSFHARTRMPSFKDTLSDEAIEDILAYLRFMADHKVCGRETPCE